MPRPRHYATNAARQAAYRARRQAGGPGDAGDGVPLPPSSRRWTGLLGQAHGLLLTVTTEMATYAAAHSERWQESERGEAFQEYWDTLDDLRAALQDALTFDG